MGAFLVNFHIRTASTAQVTDALQQIPLEQAWLAGPHDGWVSFWEEQASHQDGNRIHQLAEHVSQALNAPAIAFLVHDSDILYYCLFDNGKLLDEYNSCPDYFGEGIEEEEEKALRADCQLLAKYCRPGTKVADLEKTLSQWTQADAAAGVMDSYVFAEHRLVELTEFLGIKQELACTDYGDIGMHGMLQEIEAIWIGSQDQPDLDSETADSPGLAYSEPKLTPLHQAAAADDIATIEQLVSEGTDINEIDSMYGHTALGRAASQASPATLRKMVALGADVNKKAGNGESALLIAIHGGKVENIQTLLELGATVDEYNREVGTLLHWATQAPSLEVIKLLLEHGADPNRLNPAGFTPLACVQQQRSAFQAIKNMLGEKLPPELKAQIQQCEEVMQLLRQWTDED